VSSLEKRLSYLGIADFDYLSARLLLQNGLVFTALPKAAEAIEKLLKLFLLLEAKITRNEELDEKRMKAYGHNLTRLFAELKVKAPATFGADWDDYLTLLQDSYAQRYPEQWEELRIETSVNQLDSAYTYLRNSIIQNFPLEEQDRVRHFGTFIYDAYTNDVRELIRRLGGQAPGELLRHSNKSFELLDIDKQHI
jgi:HEPN domain-containing protein